MRRQHKKNVKKVPSWIHLLRRPALPSQGVQPLSFSTSILVVEFQDRCHEKGTKIKLDQTCFSSNAIVLALENLSSNSTYTQLSMQHFDTHKKTFCLIVLASTIETGIYSQSSRKQVGRGSNRPTGFCRNRKKDGNN